MSRSGISFAALLGVVLAAIAYIFRARQSLEVESSQSESATWNLHYRLGGYGPYVSKVNGIVPDEPLPHGCKVDQVHMLARHAERYPTLNAGTRMLKLYHRIDQANVTLNGSLAFFNTWSFLTGEPDKDFDQLTRTGPHAGTKTAFNLGVKLQTRYSDLRRSALRSGKPTSFWASDSQRVIETAQYFATAFFGLDWTANAVLHIIPETADRGADTLTPGETCKHYDDEQNDEGWNQGARMLDAYQGPYLETIRHRLLAENPNFPFHIDEIYIMHELCGFQTQIQGSSPWCEVFTNAEWESYEYARDLLHYYRSGPGNKYAATMGWLWLNATASLLKQGPEAGPFFLSFVHDGDIIPMLAALDIFPQDTHLPTDHTPGNRTWRTSDSVPMGANIIFERLTCQGEQDCWISSPMYPNHVYCSPPPNITSIRIRMNDGIVPLPGCNSGVGQSCPLGEFLTRIKSRGEEPPEFATLCGLSKDAPDHITFLHQ